MPMAFMTSALRRVEPASFWAAIEAMVAIWIGFLVALSFITARPKMMIQAMIARMPKNGCSIHETMTNTGVQGASQKAIRPPVMNSRTWSMSRNAWPPMPLRLSVESSTDLKIGSRATPSNFRPPRTSTWVRSASSRP